LRTVISKECEDLRRCKGIRFRKNHAATASRCGKMRLLLRRLGDSAAIRMRALHSDDAPASGACSACRSLRGSSTTLAAPRTHRACGGGDDGGRRSHDAGRSAVLGRRRSRRARRRRVHGLVCARPCVRAVLTTAGPADRFRWNFDPAIQTKNPRPPRSRCRWNPFGWRCRETDRPRVQACRE